MMPVRQFWRIVFSAWTLFGLFMTAQVYFVSLRFGEGMSWQQALFSEMVYAYIWAGLTPLVLKLGQRFRFEQGQLVKSLAVHIPAGILIAILHKAGHGLAMIYYRVQTAGASFTWEAWLQRMMTFLDYGILLYWMILAIAYLFEYYQRFQEKAMRAAQLEGQLAQAQLQALRMQLNPHFLFNTLNAISVLIQKDPVRARQMLGRLSELLRLALDNAGSTFVSLKEELDFLDRYLQIERMRFGERLTVQMNIAEQTLAAQIPNLILQPLIENAIRHGVNEQRGPAVLRISAQRNNGKLNLEVSDNGCGLAQTPADTGREGIGLNNTRARLSKLYGQDYRFELTNAAAGGALAVLEIPFSELQHHGQNPNSDRR
ncbi:sensor histidine kinase [candidate division KSB1 bacterium]|nr:MAG: sensor histidine kinase [candidate division KSB1 bacterium]MBC6947660.1 sensor histidine kinase [candidate division KSB1 bacterium]MCE7942254.1 sensor histidine kinase [Chlorobi bacterium CHB1]MDL1874355.1 sensor histidine kinase [Cytophagia bacterium CHB2]